MTQEKIRKILEEARSRFLENEPYLLTSTVNERSLTHKFAEYLQCIVGSKWSVDCEYNRYGSDSKIIVGLQDIIGKRVSTKETKTKTVYPDIIIHQRGPKGPNLLVIEAKKDATDEERRGDWEKLNRIKEEYNYSFATFINFLTKESDIEIEIR
jgi:hypothetical protein